MFGIVPMPSIDQSAKHHLRGAQFLCPGLVLAPM